MCGTKSTDCFVPVRFQTVFTTATPVREVGVEAPCEDANIKGFRRFKENGVKDLVNFPETL